SVVCLFKFTVTMTRPSPPPTLFPYTTLFRSRPVEGDREGSPLSPHHLPRPRELPCRRRDVLRRDHRGRAGAPPQSLDAPVVDERSEEHTSELQSRENLVCRLLLEKKKKHIAS